jgi:hypothetical protein
MSQYISGRQPFLNVGIPGITTNTPVLDVTGRVGIGITNPTADLDLSTIRIRQSLFDATNSSGELGYFLTKDAVGLKWTGVPPLNNNAIFAFQNGVLVGVSSYTGLNFISDANDLVAISTNNFNTNIVDVKINSYWIKSGNTGIYTSKFVGIGSTTPTVALDVVGDGKFTGVVTAGKFSGQSGIITGNLEVGSFIVTGVSTFVGVTTFSKVGIGSTTIPRATLDVGGDVWVSGAVTALSFTATEFFGTISTSKYADSAGFTTSISLGSTTSTDDTSYLVLVGSSGTTIQQPFIDSESLSYNAQSNTLNSDNIKVGFITATNAWIGVATINDVFRVGTAITMSNGIITATTFKGKFLDFENLNVSGIATINTGIVTSLKVTGVSTFVGIATFGTVGIGTTNIIGSDKLTIIGDARLGGQNDTFRVGTAITMSNGIITATTFKGKFLDFENLRVSGISTFTNGPVLIGGGTSTGTAGQVLQISGINSSVYIGGNIGLGSTNPTSKLFVVGDGYFTGVITASGFKGNASTATYATDAGIATNLKGSVLNVIPYQAGINSTAFLPNGSPGEYLKSNGSTLPPSWQSFPALSINVVETASTLTNYPLFVDDTGSTTSLNINKSLFAFVPQSNNPRLGIGTASPSFNLDVSGTGRFTGIVSASGLTISGIVTVGAGNTGIKIDGTTGIITSISGFTTVTFVGNLTGTASTASFATTAFNVDATAASKLIVAFASTAGIATNVIGGIASVTSLFVNTTGISTFGGSNGVVIKLDGSNGIVTSANPGVSTVTYYGDGSKLTGIAAVSATNVILNDDSSSTTTNIVFSQSPAQNPTSSLKTNSGLIFNAATSSLGIGTTLPLTPLQVEKYGVKTGFGTFTASAGITTDVDSFLISNTNFKTAEYTVYIESSSSIQAQKVLVMQNGTNAFSQEYAIMYEPTFMISIGATVSGGLCKLQFTPESGISGLVTYRFARETMI